MKPTHTWLHRTRFLSPPITACFLFLFGVVITPPSTPSYSALSKCRTQVHYHPYLFHNLNRKANPT